MKIGTLLTIEATFNESSETKKYRSKVIEKKEDYLFIDLPIDTETDKTADLSPGTPITVTYVEKNHAVEMFYSEISMHVKLNIPALAVYIPEHIKTIQRRQFVRVNSTVDVAVHGLNESFTTVTTDISGGGLSITLPRYTNLKTGDRLNTWIVLQMQSGDYHYVEITSEVIRLTQSEAGVKVGSLKFTDITNQDQQRIINYCFEKQREARRKELL